MEGAGIDDFFATRRVHFAGVRIHGPRRTRDSLVRGIVERSLADAQADAHDFTPGGDGGDSAAKGGTVTIATVVEALRRSATALHAVPAVSEARFAAVPGSYTQGADATPDSIGAVLWLEDRLRRRWGGGMTGSPSVHGAGGSVYADLSVEHALGIDDEASVKVSWGLAGSSREREVDLTWKFRGTPRAVALPFEDADDDEDSGSNGVGAGSSASAREVAGGDALLAAEEAELVIAPRWTASVNAYANDEQPGGPHTSWRMPRAGLRATFSPAQHGAASHAFALGFELRDLIPDARAPHRVLDDAGLSTKLSLSHTAQVVSLVPQLHGMFPRRGLCLRSTSEVALPPGSDCFARHEGSIRLFTPLRRMLATLSVGFRWGVAVPLGNLADGLGSGGSSKGKHDRVKVCDRVDIDVAGHAARAIGPRAPLVDGSGGTQTLGSGLAAAVDARVLFPIPSARFVSGKVYGQCFVQAGNGVAMERGGIRDAVRGLGKGARATAGVGIVKEGVAEGVDLAFNVNFPILANASDDFLNFQFAFESTRR